MTDTPLCPETGKPMVRDTLPMKISYKGQSVTIDMPGWYCHESGQSIHTGDDLKVSDKALKDLKINVENLLRPTEVKRIRKHVLKLSQQAAGAIVGGGRNAFQKYESGEVLLSRGLSNLLRVLERHPEEVENLENFKTEKRA